MPEHSEQNVRGALTLATMACAPQRDIDRLVDLGLGLGEEVRPIATRGGGVLWGSQQVSLPSHSSLEITSRSHDSQMKVTFFVELANIFCGAPSRPTAGTAVRIT